MDGYNLEDYIYSLQTRNGNDQDYSGIFLWRKNCLIAAKEANTIAYI